MFYASAILNDLSVPTGFSNLALGPRHTVAIGKDGGLRIWDAEYKLNRIYPGEQPTAIDLVGDTLLIGLAGGQVQVGQIPSGLHRFLQIQVTEVKKPIHAVRLIKDIDYYTTFVVCAGDLVYLAQVYPNGRVEIACQRPFGEHGVTAIQVVEKDDNNILIASSPIHGGLRIAHTYLRRNFTSLDFTELVTWEGQATHLHAVCNVLDIDTQAKVLVECENRALAVIDGLTGRIFCHDLVGGGLGGLPGGIGCLFDYSGKTLIFSSSKNLPELVVSHLADDETLVHWEGSCDHLEYPLFPCIVSMQGAVGFIWSNDTNTQHGIVIHEYDLSAAGYSPASASSSPADYNSMEWNDSDNIDNNDENQGRMLQEIWSDDSDESDDFYRPGVVDQDRPLEGIIEEVQHHVKDNRLPKTPNEILCHVCELEQDTLSFESDDPLLY